MKTIHCTLLFIQREDEILLAMKKRGWGVGRWNGVGGKLEPEETIEEAAVRECREEIGVTPLIFRKVAEHTFVTDNDGSEPRHLYAHTYFCTEWEGEPVETEEMAPKWFKLSDIPYDQMWHDDRYWLPRVLDGKLLKTVFTFDKDANMLSQDIREVLAL